MEQLFPVSEKSFEVGGKVFIPHSFLGTQGEGEIISKTVVGIGVLHKSKAGPDCRGFYSYEWLNETYGKRIGSPVSVPFDDPVPSLC